ncbi:MAG TPA: HU family DNA-binding protein [Nocardioidaceae bacterium]|nr:HU family DNA-binding protein [Nocardioidaceae bacterium]
MNKSQLVDTLATRFDGNRKAASHALESVLDTITREVAKGEKVAITGFGSFEKRVRDARWVRNPRTGERIKAKKTAVPKFSAGADLKAVVSGAKKLPKLAAGTAKAAAGKAAAGKAAPAKKTATKSTAKSAAPAKKTATKTASKSAAKSAPAKKTATKTATKSAAKSAPAKKTATKSAAKTAPAKKTSTAKKAPAKKSTAKKSTAKKA